MTWKYSSAYDVPTWDKTNCPLSKRLQDLIKDPGALAAFLGCTVQAVNQYKQGTAFPKTENLIKIAEYYYVSLDYLLGFTNIPNRDTTLQSINEVTGLSVDAICKLNDISKSNPAFCEIISLMLEDHNCEYFLALIQGLLRDKTDLVELAIQGEKMRIEDRHLLAAVLQSHLIENIGELSKRYNAK